MKYQGRQIGAADQTAGVTVPQESAKSPPRPAADPDKTMPQVEAASSPKNAVTQPALPGITPDAFAANAPHIEPPNRPADDAEIPPSLYGRFEAFRFLGRGGMGAVYKARDLRLDREVAIKLLFGADPERGGSLLREARAQARIAHENVCEVYEAGTADHVRYIVMQLIAGDPLDKARASMTLEEKVRVIREIASALHEAHRLGMVHRDVKPGNIMVERGDDGAWKPYIMDFGLAREMGDSGATVTGALSGTPAFMAPEQAAGRVRTLDRRTDVYALGASLYDVLVGRPPIVGDDLGKLLHAIGTEEPQTIRQIDRNVPPDLEAIVMKCLEKQPSARYDSAKALGDDLQRFLDGEPVQARRRALGYVLWRAAKRHKGKVAVASAALLAVLVVVALWVRARRIAAAEAELSRELGESVKEMELFLRNAHGMPLHDVEREGDIVRARLKEIEGRMAAAGAIGVGPGHYALGRGHLALQEPFAALSHLKKAEAAGYRSAGLDYALGMALSELYKVELEATKRIEGAEQKKQRIAALDAEYKQPALGHLRAALGGAIEAPAFVEGLIALYEERHEDARALAREAFAKAPWLYEAKKLEGDVLFAIGSRYRHDAAFDFKAMMSWFGQAAEAYRVAADLGRSDPTVYEAECELWTQAMNGESARGQSMRPSFEKARLACEKASAASSRSAAGTVKLAWAHNCFAWWVATGEHEGEDPEQAIKDAIERAEEAARRSPSDAMAGYLTGAVWRTRALYSAARGLGAGPAIEQAIAGYEAVLELDPSFLWARSELCSTLGMRVRRESLHGVDPADTVERAAEQCDRAIAQNPGFLPPRFGKINVFINLAEHLVATGRAPDEAVHRARAVIDGLKEQGHSVSSIPVWQTFLLRIEATYALESGADPGPILAKADASLKEYERLQPKSPMTFELRGQISLIKARWLLARGEDAAALLREAREAFENTVKAKPWDLGYHVWRALFEHAAIGDALDRGEADEATIQVALDKLLPLIAVKRDDPRPYEALARLYELGAAPPRAERRSEAGEEKLTRGLAMAEEALAINPRMAAALSTKGRLLLRKAKLEKEPSDRTARAEEALSAFASAARENPLMERSQKGAVEEGKRLAAQDR
jgi:serine/threonine-protein kinase